MYLKILYCVGRLKTANCISGTTWIAWGPKKGTFGSAPWPSTTANGTRPKYRDTVHRPFWNLTVEKENITTKLIGSKGISGWWWTSKKECTPVERLSTRAFEHLKYTVTSKKVNGREKSVTVSDYKFDKILINAVSLSSCHRLIQTVFRFMRKATVSSKLAYSVIM